MTAATLRPHWTVRHEPLQPAAVIAAGAVVPALAADTVVRLGRGASLYAVHAPGWLLVLGATDDLPWADGVVYLGHEHGLLLPTTEEPQPSGSFLAAALPPAPLRAVLPGRLFTATLPTRPPDPVRLAGLR